MKKTMLALVKPAPGPGLVMQEVPVPEYGPNEVMIKIRKTSICGTDVHIYNWDEWSQQTIKPPTWVGHEYVGEIVAMGSEVQGLKIGQRVSGEGHIVCGKCRNCLTGNAHICKNTTGVGVNRVGAFAEYLVIPAENVREVPEKVSDDVVSCFDGLGNAVHAALYYNVLGEDVLITGAGPIGLMATAVVKQAGARSVTITDMNDYRLDLAKKMGATCTVNVGREKLEDVWPILGMKEGFDVGIEMSGSGIALNQMLNNMIPGGRIALLGLLSENTRINWTQFIFGGMQFKGIYGRETYMTWRKINGLIEAGLDIEPIITHRFDARDFEKGFAAMNSGNSGKVVLDWTKL